MPKVTVYYFEGQDQISGKILRSERMATLDWIKEWTRGTHVLSETAKEIEISRLDADGLYRNPQQI
jgi:hypothetical protein